MSEQTNVSLVLTVAYDGQAYSGFAKQKDPAVVTVQGNLEQALATLFRRTVDTVCAGRTDAGVHAAGQVVSCELARAEREQHSRHQMLVSLNALTPDDISIVDVACAGEGFSARFDAASREYRYRIVCGSVAPLFLRSYAWWYRGTLDVEAMREGARFLVGEHDFKSFCKAASAKGKNTVRRIEGIEFLTEEHLGEECLEARIVGNAFLHSMVRTIMGTLAQVGAGRRSPEWVAEVLAACDRGAAGENAPASGLTLWRVVYPEGLIEPWET